MTALLLGWSNVMSIYLLVFLVIYLLVFLVIARIIFTSNVFSFVSETPGQP